MMPTPSTRLLLVRQWSAIIVFVSCATASTTNTSSSSSAAATPTPYMARGLNFNPTGQIQRHLYSSSRRPLPLAFQQSTTLNPVVWSRRSSSTKATISFFGRAPSTTTTTTHQHCTSSNSCTRLFQNMNFADASGEQGGNDNALQASGEEEDDPLKWEKMYNKPTQQKQSTNTEQLFTSSYSNGQPATSTFDAAATTKSDIRVVTFDLDNTVWKTMATISEANDVLALHLKDTFGIDERSEKRMGMIFKQNMDAYAGIDYSNEDENDDDGEVSGNDGRGSNNGEGGEDNDYVNRMQNVGQSEISLPPSDDASNKNGDKEGGSGDDNDDGVHIQAKKKKPVYLTKLRKDSIRSLMQEAEASSIAISAMDMEDQVDMAFEKWMEARCQSISQNFAPSAVETLTNLKSRLSPTGEKMVYVGAITDGNSNPTAVPELDGVFDFVIRAEDVGASKPDKRVYKAAVAALMAKLVNDGRNVEDFFLGNNKSSRVSLEEQTNNQGVVDDDDDDDAPYDSYMTTTFDSSTSWKDVEVEAVEAFSDAVGPWWVHIGDDFFKDVVAAKEFRMRTVWTRELIGGAGGAMMMADASEEKSKKAKEERSVADLMKDVAKSNDGILKMSIGESEFLSLSLHEEFSDAILDRFEDLGGLLLQWHEEGNVAALSNNLNGGPSLADNVIGSKMESDIDNTSMSRAAIGMESQQTAEDSSADNNGQSKTKFCVFCGGQLPAVAKFCAHCGERQQ